jgi:hypothetical protein
MFTDKADLGSGQSFIFKKVGEPANGARAEWSNWD